MEERLVEERPFEAALGSPVTGRLAVRHTRAELDKLGVKIQDLCSSNKLAHSRLWPPT